MKKKIFKYLLHALWIIPLALVVISLIPVRMAIPNDRKVFDSFALQPDERWFVVEPCQTSNASWRSEVNSMNTTGVYFSELTGNDPWSSFRSAFAQGHLPGGGANKNHYLLIGTMEKEGGDSSYNDAVLNVRKWYIITPVNRDFMIGPPWYLNKFDLK